MSATDEIYTQRKGIHNSFEGTASPTSLSHKKKKKKHTSEPHRNDNILRLGKQHT